MKLPTSVLIRITPLTFQLPVLSSKKILRYILCIAIAWCIIFVLLISKRQQNILHGDNNTNKNNDNDRQWQELCNSIASNNNDRKNINACKDSWEFLHGEGIIGKNDQINNSPYDDDTTTFFEYGSRNKKGKEETNHQPRMLLGIFSKSDTFYEPQLRHLIRNTYVNFDLIHRTDTPDRVCSFPDFLKKWYNKTYVWSSSYECQMIYIFILDTPHKKNNQRDGNDDRNDENLTQKLFPDVVGASLHDFDDKMDSFNSISNHPVSIANNTSSSSSSSKIKHNEIDVIHLNFIESDGTAMGDVTKLLAWFKFCCRRRRHRSDLHHESHHGHDYTYDQDMFDYVAYTDTQVILHPTIFWNNSIFSSSSSSLLRDSSNHYVYGGISTSECKRQRQCPALNINDNEYFMSRFVLVSNNLANHIATTITSHQLVMTMTSTTTASKMKRISKSKESADIFLANYLFQNYPVQILTDADDGGDEKHNKKVLNDNKIINKTLTVASLYGFELRNERPKDVANTFLSCWDAYKDTLVDYDQITDISRKYSLFVDMEDGDDPDANRLNQTISFMNKHDGNDNHHSNDNTINHNGTRYYHRSNPKILMGIFTMDSKEERHRRELIRDTYLNYFTLKQEKFQTPNRICSLHELLRRRQRQYHHERRRRRHHREEEHSKKSKNHANNNNNNNNDEYSDNHDSIDNFQHLWEECQMVYTFVMGANPNGPKELVTLNTSFPITVPQSSLAIGGGDDTDNNNNTDVHRLSHVTRNEVDPNTTDIVYLNIQENMKEGKSQTWLKYSMHVMKMMNNIRNVKNAMNRITLNQRQEQQQKQQVDKEEINDDDDDGGKYNVFNNTDLIIFDYVGKMDSDVVLHTKKFLNRIVNPLPMVPHNQRIYIGDYRIKPSIYTAELHGNIGPCYMGGPIYILSPDLINYITSDDCPRSSVAIYSEDQSMGNFVHTYPIKTIRRISISSLSEKAIRDSNNNGNNDDRVIYKHPVKDLRTAKRLWNKIK